MIARVISAEDHLRWLDSRPEVSFLQTPAWGRLKAEWRHESVGFFAQDPADGRSEGTGEQVGAALVLYRPLPRINRSLAYVPEGPVLDWSGPEVTAVLAALRDHVRAAGAFAMRIGPTVPVRSWSAATIKDAIADPAVTSLTEVEPSRTYPVGERIATLMRRLEMLPVTTDEGFATGQPNFVFQLPVGGRTDEELLAGMNQQWRRNIKKAAKAGVQISRGSAEDLPAFHAVYLETAARDHFTPRPCSYFQDMFAAMTAEDPDRIRLYLAHHEGDLVAATIWIRVGQHAWYSYGASTSAKREVQGSNAIQWQMIRDARDAGAGVYDLRGITTTVAESDPHVGLIRFKVGTGGEAVEFVGEHDYPLNPLLYKAFQFYLKRRG